MGTKGIPCLWLEPWEEEPSWEWSPAFRAQLGGLDTWGNWSMPPSAPTEPTELRDQNRLPDLRPHPPKPHCSLLHGWLSSRADTNLFGRPRFGAIWDHPNQTAGHTLTMQGAGWVPSWTLPLCLQPVISSVDPVSIPWPFTWQAQPSVCPVSTQAFWHSQSL